VLSFDLIEVALRSIGDRSSSQGIRDEVDGEAPALPPELGGQAGIVDFLTGRNGAGRKGSSKRGSVVENRVGRSELGEISPKDGVS
jgi:hypothetical protein